MLGAGCGSTPGTADEEPQPNENADPSTADGADFDALYEAAKEEGALTWYSKAPSSYVEEAADAFSTEYPGIEVTTFSQTAAPLMERFQAELSRGDVQADLLQMDADAFADLIEDDRLVDYTPADSEKFPEEYRRFEPYGWPDRLIEHVVVYNTDQVSAEEAASLETWEDVVDPRWRGRVAIADPNLVGGWYNGFYMLWKEYGTEWLEALANLDPIIYNSNIPAVESVVSGQNDMALTIDPYAGDYWERGAPIAAEWPTPTPKWGGLIGIVADSPNPNAAKLFEEWFLSEKGMRVWADIYQATVPHEDVPDQRALTQAEWYGGGAQEVHVLDVRAQLEDGGEFLEAWNKIDWAATLED